MLVLNLENSPKSRSNYMKQNFVVTNQVYCKSETKTFQKIYNTASKELGILPRFQM